MAEKTVKKQVTLRLSPAQAAELDKRAGDSLSAYVRDRLFGEPDSAEPTLAQLHQAAERFGGQVELRKLILRAKEISDASG